MKSASCLASLVSSCPLGVSLRSRDNGVSCIIAGNLQGTSRVQSLSRKIALGCSAPRLGLVLAFHPQPPQRVPNLFLVLPLTLRSGLMIVCMSVYAVAWNIGNRRSLQREADRVAALRASGHLTEHEKGALGAGEGA